MRFTKVLLFVFFVALLLSCSKDPRYNPSDSPAPDSSYTVPKHELLKDIIIPHLPSPYYHFEYNADSLVTKADFASGYFMYDVIYKGGKIAEMRNNIIVNHDTLRYFYEDDGKLALVDFINERNLRFRYAILTYQGNYVKEIFWRRLNSDGSFLIDRILTFTYYSDGIVKTIQDYRAPIGTAVPAYTYLTTFEQYDNGINVDDFSLIHDGIHDHLFLLPNTRIQKNNPLKESFSINGTEYYNVKYNYVYTSSHVPVSKTGDFTYVSGPDAGKKFVTNVMYTYY